MDFSKKDCKDSIFYITFKKEDSYFTQKRTDCHEDNRFLAFL